MSDLLIRGMKMPETCKLCYLSEFDPGFYAYVCKPTGMRIDYDMAKIDRPRRICPLVPVPPHGDLIDKKTVSENLASVLNKRNPPFSYPDWNDAIIAMLNAPTIIPAEEGET